MENKATHGLSEAVTPGRPERCPDHFEMSNDYLQCTLDRGHRELHRNRLCTWFDAFPDSGNEEQNSQGAGSRKGGEAPTVDLIAHLRRQHEWSERTFGPGHRTAGVIDHIRKELREIEESPLDLSEWIDVAILALDGAWRSGASPEEIASALLTKQAKNEARTWPDWRTQRADKAIEHDRNGD